jgi:hypothetical protein
MQFAGREFVLRKDLWMSEAKRGLHLCDKIRESTAADLPNTETGINDGLLTQWREFCAIAFEGGWPAEYKDLPEPAVVGEMMSLFIQARSRTTASNPSAEPSQV